MLKRRERKLEINLNSLQKKFEAGNRNIQTHVTMDHLNTKYLPSISNFSESEVKKTLVCSSFIILCDLSFKIESLIFHEIEISVQKIHDLFTN